jgi:hypothetical protein
VRQPPHYLLIVPDRPNNLQHAPAFERHGKSSPSQTVVFDTLVCDFKNGCDGELPQSVSIVVTGDECTRVFPGSKDS